jgi:glycosyltransferase involved in cell wall biosynthesis
VRPEIALIGHPFAPIGMGEHVRCSFRAFRSVARKPALIDLYGMSDALESGTLDLVRYASDTLGDVNVFHINADEVELALATLDERIPRNAYNIIYPAWELASYPDPWVRILERFDEAWAPSAFIADALREKLSKPVVEMPLATEVLLESFLSRRYFGIAENAYVFLFFYDFRSYASRKNPRAVLEAFRCMVQRRPYVNTQIVIKSHGGDGASSRALLDEFSDIASRIILIDRTMTDNETKNLVRCTDAFVSLHRSEGFGRGMAEAMYLGKPVVATGYSGNMTFMNAGNAHLVDYRLVPLEPDAYPFWQGQVWADPDVDAAAAKLVELVDSPEAGRELGRKASLDIRRTLSYRAAGSRYVDRIETISRTRTSRTQNHQTSLNV